MRQALRISSNTRPEALGILLLQYGAMHVIPSSLSKRSLCSLYVDKYWSGSTHNSTASLYNYYDEKIVYPILILSESIFEIRQNGMLGFSIPYLVPEIFRFLKYANEKHITSFTHID